MKELHSGFSIAFLHLKTEWTHDDNSPLRVPPNPSGFSFSTLKRFQLLLWNRLSLLVALLNLQDVSQSLPTPECSARALSHGRDGTWAAYDSDVSTQEGDMEVAKTAQSAREPELWDQ